MADLAGAVLVAAIEGTELTTDERRFFSQNAASGITLFKRNIPPRLAELETLVASLQTLGSAGTSPLVVAIDQEGGRVSRIAPPFPNLGPAKLLFEGNDDERSLGLLENYAYTVGSCLGRLGINVNFAPVVDILTEPSNEAIGDRVFGVEPGQVTRRAGAFLSGMQAAGVKGCLKHFPGQGEARVDTHVGGARIDLSRETLEGRELVPFKALMAAAPMVMVAHCVYPALDDQPASLSRKIMQGLLREELGFSGVIVSDDMNMGAVPQDEQDWQAAIVASLAAGADMMLVCRHLERAILALEAIRAEAQRSPAFAARLEDAARRVMTLRKSLLPPRVV